jgi:hypothetical protein
MAAFALPFVVTVVLAVPLGAQSMATLQGRVLDSSGGVLRDATIRVRNVLTGFDRAVVTDRDGRYRVEDIPAQKYEITVAANGFKSAVIPELSFEVGRTVVRDFHLEIGDTSEAVVVRGNTPLVDRVTTGVSHVLTSQTVQEIPLNGRYFTDLALLAPGTVTPSQTGFSTTPLRGIGAVAINTAGNREEASGFLVNGVSVTNQTFGSLGFQPPIGSIQEFKLDHSPFSVEEGHVSGAIVSIVTRSGTNAFHGDAFEFLRNDALDARNFFEFTSADPHPFERNQFGGSLGGPIVRDRTLFFVTYEGLRQRQGLDINSLVLSDDQRAAATDAVMRRLIDFVPRANFFDANGTPYFVGSASARVDTDHWTVDLSQNVSRNNRLHAFYGNQHILSREPTSSGTSIPGFGTVSRIRRQVLTVSDTHIFGPAVVNEGRFGLYGVRGTVVPAAALDPAQVGIRNGVASPIGLPQLIVAGGGLNFGGPANFPAGRDDTLYGIANTLSIVSGRHAVRLGGEYRHFINENVAEGTGAFNFPSVQAFVAGTANAFAITLGARTSHIDQRSVAGFVQDRVSIHPRVTLDLGLRYEWHVTPTERDDRFVVFDSETASLQRVGVDIDGPIYQQNQNLEPRAGIAWDLSGDGRTVVRGVYGAAVDQPGTTAVNGTAANPPFARPLAATGSIPLGDAIDQTRDAALVAPVTVDPEFRNATVRSWNVNVQRQLGPNLAAMVGYFGSRGRHLRISRNINQPIAGVRPFTALSPDSPILPGVPLGNITQVETSAFSSYNALWASATQRLSRGLQFDVSYTWAKSLDTNSLNSSGFAVQDAYDIPNEYGLSDFDARHRLILSGIYALPFDHWLIRGWQLAAIVQAQSGNPVNIVTSNSTLNGLPNTVRPDVIGPIRIIGAVEQWFDPSAFAAVDRFGTLGRNVVIGPAFHNMDLSVMRTISVGAGVHLHFRVDIFDLFNHPNFGPPGNVVGSSTFGRITRTRFPTGEVGSSRQIQLAVKLSF